MTELRKFVIESNREVALKTRRMELRSVEDGYDFSGEFVDVAVPGFYLRRPLSVCDHAHNRLTLLYKVVGEGTEALSRMTEGEELELMTGLGKGFDAGACSSSALLVGGGMGIAPLLPLARSLAAQGKEMTVVLGFNTKEEKVLEEEFRGLTPNVVVSTADGSLGVKGFVTDAIKAVRPHFDFFYACGPLPMMKAVCGLLAEPGEVSLEERMGCGAGFCYGCTCRTLLGPKRICKDGPVFRKEEIQW